MASRKKIVSLRQLEVLVEFLENHRDLAIGRLRSKEARALSQRLWIKCSILLNAESDGASRTPVEWKKWYTDYKSRLLGREKQLRDNHTGTGADPGVSVVPLAATEERLCALLRGTSDHHEEVLVEVQTTQSLPRKRQPRTRRPKRLGVPPENNEKKPLPSSLEESRQTLLRLETHRCDTTLALADSLRQMAASLAQTAGAINNLTQAQQNLARRLQYDRRRRRQFFF